MSETGGRQGGNLSASVPDVETNRFIFDLNGKKETLSLALQEFRQEKSHNLEKKRTEIIE